MSGGNICKMATALNVPESYFFEGLNGRGAAKSGDGLNAFRDVLTTRDGQSLVTAFGRIKSEAVRHSVVRLVDLLSA